MTDRQQCIQNFVSRINSVDYRGPEAVGAVTAALQDLVAGLSSGSGGSGRRGRRSRRGGLDIAQRFQAVAQALQTANDPTSIARAFARLAGD